MCVKHNILFKFKIRNGKLILNYDNYSKDCLKFRAQAGHGKTIIGQIPERIHKFLPKLALRLFSLFTMNIEWNSVPMWILDTNVVPKKDIN